MLTVGVRDSDVERRLLGGRLRCPDCAGVLARWGHARPRVVRGWCGAVVRLRPRRARCGSCARTHVLLPVTCLLRRADAVTVIGPALLDKAGGAGYRVIAARLGRPAATVRGWLRRFGARAGPWRVAFTALLCQLDADPPVLDPSGSPLADAVAAIGAAAAAVARRWGPVVFAVSPWEVAGAVTSARLLSPASTGQSINTSCPW
jgi:hypothetical protein